MPVSSCFVCCWPPSSRADRSCSDSMTPSSGAGGKDSRPRHLSRSGPLFGFPFRQDQWFTLAQPDASRRDSVGRTCVGTSVPHRAGTLTAVLAKGGTQTQTPHRLGASACPPGAALVPEPHARRSDRWCVRRPATAVAVGRASKTDRLYHPAATGRTPVSACTPAQERCHGASVARRKSHAFSAPRFGQPPHKVAAAIRE